MRLTKRKADEPDQDEQFRKQQHLQNVSTPADGAVDTQNFIEEITSTELEIETVQLLDNMLSSDWVLANFSDAEVHETRWLTRVMMLQLEALHPPEDSIWQGKYRMYASGNERQALTALDSAQRLEVFELVQGVISRATRGKDGWQQENFNKTHRVSETLDRSDEEDGGFLS